MENTVDIYKVHLEAFIKVATAVTTSSTNVGAYSGSTAGPSASPSPKPGKQASLSSYTLKELTVSPVYVFVNVPVCRAAALQFFGTLIREHVAIYLSSVENPGQTADYSNIEEALNEVDAAMQQDLRERDGNGCLQLFEWSLDTLAEISKKYANRRALAGGSGAMAGGDSGLGDVLQTYTSCRSTRLLLELLNECVGRLLVASPEQCIASLLETAARFGNYCDWILTFIGTKYPKTIIDRLLTIGAADFSTYVVEMTGKQSMMNVKQIIAKQDQYHREKLASLSGILGHLAHQQGAELRRQLSTVIQDGLAPNASQRQQHALAFVLKAASLSKEVADLLLQDLHHLVTADKIATISRIFGAIPQVIIFGEQNPAHLLISVIMGLKESTMSLLYDKLLHLAFDELDIERQDPRTNVYLIQKYALSVLEVLMTNMERQVHNNISFPAESTPLLNEIEKNLPLALKRLFSRNEMQRNYYFKCLTLLCFVRGEAKTVEILANVLFHAANEQQLSLFVSFCRILHPVHVKSVEQLFVQLPDRYQRYREAVTLGTMEDHSDNEWLWIDNVRTLLCWDQASVANKEINIMNLTEIFLNRYSDIAEYLLPLVCVKSCSRTIVDILTKIGQPVHLSPKNVLRIVTYCCSLVFRTLDDVGTPDGLELNKCFVEYFVMFVHSQPSYAIEIALRTLLARIMRMDQGEYAKCSSQNICALMGLSCEDKDTSNGVVEGEGCNRREHGNSHAAITKQEAPVTGQDVAKMVAREKAQSTFASTSAPLLVGNKTNGPKTNATEENGSYTSLHLVHSGVIRRPPIDRAGEKATSEKAILCKLSFVRLFDRLCSTVRPSSAGGPTSSSSGIGQSPNSYSLDVCRLLASMLSEHFCPDAIAADHSWEDWESTRNSPERFLATSKRIEEIPFSWDLLNIVAEAYPCLWFFAPLIKSVLGTAILQCENAIDKTEKAPPKLIKTLENFFLVLYKGRVLREPLSFVIDLIPHVSVYETSCILGAVWQYFQAVTPGAKTLEHHFECIQCNFGSSLEPIKGDHQQYLETILLVIQANISRAGHLLGKFVDVSEKMDCNE